MGWIAHHLIGITFAMGFVAFVGSNWLQHPTLIPALIFSIFTVLAPFLIMQPVPGIAASKASNPLHARLQSLMNDTVFGIGLDLFGWFTHWLLC